MESVFNLEHQYNIVINEDHFYAIWPVFKDLPAGWKPAGKSGTKADCIKQINALAQDYLASSAKRQFDQQQQSTPPANITVPSIFESLIDQMPTNRYICDETQAVNYAELNDKANQLAHYMRSFHIEAGTRVGVYLDRSIEMLLAVLAIMKSGCIYVPLDPSYPKYRLLFIAEHAQVSLLITREAIDDPLFLGDTQKIFVDTEKNQILAQNATNLSYRVDPRQVSHIIFTSGSTGVPKGVIVTHESLCANMLSIRDALQITGSHIYLHTASIAFTSSLRQFFLPLILGAGLVIANDEQRKNPLSLFSLIKQRRISVFDTVAPYWELCVDSLGALDSDALATLLDNDLKFILSSGGALPSRIPLAWKHQLDHQAQMVNMYGQTETIGNIVTFPIPATMDQKGDTVPIGMPIACTTAYLLDEQLQPVEIGTPAEIHIGGISVANGYTNRPDLSADKFIPNPYGQVPGERLYKTGDYGRLLPDGSIEFVGRRDLQIKIRGFRIEPNEIECVLKSQPAITEAVVVAVSDEAGQKVLVAYIMCRENMRTTQKELRVLLTDTFPDYMIPSHFVFLDALPRLPNGKIDRQALPAPEKKRPHLDLAYVAPKTPLQKYLASIWREYLRIAEIGLNDKFFELGGTSFQAAQIVNRIQNDLQIAPFITSLFEAPTVSEYATFLRTNFAAQIAEKYPETNNKQSVSENSDCISTKKKAIDNRRNYSHKLRQLRNKIRR